MYTYEWKKHKIKYLNKLHSLHVKPTVQNLKIALQFCGNYLQHTCRPAKCEPFFKFPKRLSFCCSGFLINRNSNICSHLLANFIECLQRRNKEATCSLTNTSSDQLLGSLGNLVISSRFGSILLVLGNLFLKLHVKFNVIIFMPTTLPTICA